MNSLSPLNSEKPIVFFDGFCKLCDRFVNFLLPRSKNIYFSSLQSDFSKKTLSGFDLPDSLVFRSQSGEIYTRSEAFLRAISSIGGAWKYALFFLIVPQRIRDLIYDQVATRRYNWFGKRESCRIASSEEKSRFLENLDCDTSLEDNL